MLKSLRRKYNYWKFKRTTKRLIDTFKELEICGYDTSFCFDELRYELEKRRMNVQLGEFLRKYEFESIPELWSDHILITYDLSSYWRVRDGCY